MAAARTVDVTEVDGSGGTAARALDRLTVELRPSPRALGPTTRGVA